MVVFDWRRSKTITLDPPVPRMDAEQMELRRIEAETFRHPHKPY
jgi:hypothetical protein